MDWSKYAGKPYRPSNGTEGEMFMDRFCYQCKNDANFDCAILAKTMIFDVDEDGYPKEWIRDGKGYPKCTAFNKVS